MSTLLEIHDLPETGQVQVYLRTPEGIRSAPASEFQDPLDPSDVTEIDWYFQEFLDHPVGEAKARAEAVEAGLPNLGRLLFEQVLRASDEANALYSEVMASGPEQCQLAVLSLRSEFLAIPWELLNEPTGGYIAPKFGSIIRASNLETLPAFETKLSTEQLNVLLVAPLPTSAAEAPASLAAATIGILESLNVPAELEYLRPPTWEALAETLAQRPGYYHLVHFDSMILSNPSGQLLLEDSNSEPAPLEASALAAALRAAEVPIVVLSPGNTASSPVGRQWAHTAQGLAEAGVPQVLCLPYGISGAAARESLLRNIYQALIEGETPASCLARARRALMDAPQRPSIIGKQVFWDWITPTAYHSATYQPQPIEEEKPDLLAAPVIQPQEESTTESQLPAAGQYGLVGRQGEIRQVEQLLQVSPVTLLSGNTGVGKTELALGLARWSQRTALQTFSGGVFYTTFEVSHPSGVQRVVHEIGTSLAGLEFAELQPEQQRQWVVQYLQEQPSLLIWDGVENVAGFPSGSPGLLEEPEQADLDRFLGETTREGPSRALLLTRRRAESWVSGQPARLELNGLAGRDRMELASAILEKAAAEVNHIGPECLDLLAAIQGHPLAMQVALPMLREIPASVLLGELRKGLEQLAESSKEEGRDDFLTVLMEYSFSRMSHRSRTHLPFLALFQRRVMMDIMNHITQEQAYRRAMGEELGWGACRTLLRSALAAGFLDPVSPSVYQIHSAVPWFLGQKLSRQVAGAGIGQLEQEFVRVYADTADYFMESLYENQDSGATAILAEEGNLTQALGLALESQQWDNAQLLVQPLAQVYRMQMRYPELRRLRGQLLDTVGSTASEADSNGGIDLWLYLLGTDANESVDLGELDRAEELNQQLLEYLEAQSGSESDPRAGAVYHQFGAIALQRYQLEEAEQWLRKSLAIIESGEDRASVADDYFALGQVAQYQRRYTDAKDWYSKALDIHQRLPDEEEMVKDYRALGMVTQLKFDHKEAESWYHRARDLVEEHRDEETAILVFHELGTVNHAQFLFDEAKNFYQQALTLCDRLGKEAQMAVELHHMGMLEQDRGILYEEAESWYLAALERRENLGDRRGVGDECRQLGVLFHEQKKYDEAEEWYNQAREVFEELGDVQRLARTYGQLGMVAEERENIGGALEWVARTYQLVTTYNLPVLIQVKAHMGRLREKYGEEDFNQWWQSFTGEAPPEDLEVDTSTIL
ncbi:MAG: tetratricopeptide repeat protein [Dehalococcoidia bacterium]